MKRHLLYVPLAALLAVFALGCSDDDSGPIHNNNNNQNPVCGDNLAEGLELCDGLDLGGNDCASIGQGFTSGTLACNSTCDGWDTSQCTGGATCGDDTVEGLELCDGSDLDGNDCTTIGLGFTGGTLACNGTCDGWDTSQCSGGATCGDDTVEGNELCDGSDLDGNDCTTIGGGYDGGTLACNDTCDGWDTSQCTGGPTCGDDTVEGNELCDGSDLDGNDCTTIGLGFTGGTLACNDTCDGWDTAQCTGGSATCGDNTVEGNELCDGSDLDGNDCTTIGQGFTGGTLACNGTCDGWDTAQCTGGSATCGNNTQEGSEVCDGSDMDGQTCSDEGYTGGALNCTTACDGLVTTGCFNGPETCGDGVIEGLERCDGSELDGADCTSFGFTGGTLACTDNCMFDLSGCNGDMCQQQNWYNDGYCDLCELYGGTVDPDCATVCTTGDSACGSYIDSIAGMSTCLWAEGTEDPDCGSCGDNTLDTPEYCDGQDLGGADCTSYGYSGGTLACNSDCSLDTSGCTFPTCGNNIAEGIEVCDGTDLGGNTCTSIGQGFTGGTLACNGTCDGWDTSQCTSGGQFCGNDNIEGTELCDGDDMGGQTCPDGGTIACNDTCDGLNEFACFNGPETCGNNTIEGREECDGSDLSGYGCTDFGFSGGTLGCTAGCVFDLSQCNGDFCQVNNWYNDGYCDPCEIMGDSGTPDPDCANHCIGEGNCASWVINQTGVSTCLWSQGTEDPDCGTCGDNTMDDPEYCDGQDFGGADCTSYGYSGGTLDCNSDCSLDTSGCTL
jgi:hypothetical protein